MAKFDSIQKNMFFPEDEGQVEKNTLKKLNNKKNNEKRNAKRKEAEHQKKMDILHQFEKEHPESFLFKEDYDNILKNIISECVQKVIKESTNDNILRDLENKSESKYMKEEPEYFTNEFKEYIESILMDAYYKNNGDDEMVNNYYEGNPEDVPNYVNTLRNIVNNDFNILYNDLKNRQIKANADLDECIKMFTNYRQGKRPIENKYGFMF